MWMYVLDVAETKTDQSFHFAPFFLNGFHNCYRLDIDSKRGVIWIYIRSSVPSHPLKGFVVPFDIQAISFEINLRRNGFFYAFINFHQYFLHSISNIIDH